MKKLCVVLLFALAACLVRPQTADAIPPFKKGFEAKYKTKTASKEFTAAIKKAGCNICHVKGKGKKFKNEYGMALSKLLKKSDFSKKKIEADPEGTKKAMAEGFAKVEKAKNKKGMTFGEILKSGKLPQ